MRCAVLHPHNEFICLLECSYYTHCMLKWVGEVDVKKPKLIHVKVMQKCECGKLSCD